ncbi:hypothetical protein CJF39_06065 [Pseudomonas lundensis]|uniref:Prophage PSSB64-02 n=1 Tax=Pseudomonas lundensis TaxID=86185 RepID=A0A266NDF5_9PSED|nr:hypothetical protein [Pseudomonas lundensis]OZY60443.1 hypothetical protein CJF39_06065 [Pseudomonas lundensis]
MALSQKQRDERTSLRRSKAQEEELRLRVRPGTRQALADLMEWSGITEQGEAMTLMIHHLHAMGAAKCQPLLNPPRHEIEISQNVAREFRNKSLLAIQKDPGDEIIEPA